jgi:nicotinate-nucleotide adenylyltransferase
MKIGLFFGSFNPVHCGHMIIASYLAEFTDLDKVWFVVSPHNPLKPKQSLLKDHHRLQMVRIAIDDYPKLKASDIEFGLPQPSYTIHTLAHLFDKHPEHQFVLLLGADNLETFKKWKNWEQILEQVELYVYPRNGSDGGKLLHHPKVKVINAPVMELSSTFIRESIAGGKDVRYMVPGAVWTYLREMHFYEARQPD